MSVLLCWYIGVSTGKVDLQCLLQCDDPSLYLTPPHPTATPHPSPHPSPQSSVFLPRGVADVEDELLSVVTRLTHLREWAHNSTLLDLGATSFDIVRIADHLETKFSDFSRFSSLTDVLLARTFKEVADYLWAGLGDGGGVCEVSEGERGEIEVEPLRKKARKDSEIITSKKVELASTDGSIKAWQRGKLFCDGE